MKMNLEINELKRTDNIKQNIQFLMKKHNVPNITTLAKILGIPATTLYSFLRNPLSASKAKTKITEYFNISLEELECSNLYETASMNKNDFIEDYSYVALDSSKSILSISDNDIVEKLSNSNTNDAYMKELKESIAKSYRIGYRHFIGQAKNDYMMGNFQKALCSISAAFWLIRPDELEWIQESDFKLYIELGKHFNDENIIVKLVEVFISYNYCNKKILAILGDLLEASYPDYAKVCYETIINEKL